MLRLVSTLFSILDVIQLVFISINACGRKNQLSPSKPLMFDSRFYVNLKTDYDTCSKYLIVQSFCCESKKIGAQVTPIICKSCNNNTFISKFNTHYIFNNGNKLQCYLALISIYSTNYILIGLQNLRTYNLYIYSLFGYTLICKKL